MWYELNAKNTLKNRFLGHHVIFPHTDATVKHEKIILLFFWHLKWRNFSLIPEFKKKSWIVSEDFCMARKIYQSTNQCKLSKYFLIAHIMCFPVFELSVLEATHVSHLDAVSVWIWDIKPQVVHHYNIM